MRNEHICLVATIKTTVELTLMFVNYYLNKGVDHVIIYFDDPYDPAIDELAGYERVTKIKCDAKYREARGVNPEHTHIEKQTINSGDGFKLAAKLGCDWVIHLDHDELIYCDEDLRTVLARVDKNIDYVRFLPCEALPEQDHYSRPFEEITNFKLLPTRFRKCLAYMLFCKSAFCDGSFFYGHEIGKSATRVSSRIACIKPHFPTPRDNVELISSVLPEAKLLHFDCMGLDPWKQKWIDRMLLGARGAMMFGMRDHRKSQLENFSQAYLEEDDNKVNELYRQYYLLSRYHKHILTRLGLIRTFHVDKQLFLET